MLSDAGFRAQEALTPDTFESPPMGRITSNVGLITGIPIEETIKKLLEIQAAPRDRLVSRNEELDKQQVALTELSALLLAFQFTATNLGRPDLFKSRTATSSNPSLLSVTSSGTPPLGTYQFTPLQTVQAHQVLSSGVTSNTATLGAGQLSLGFGGFVDDDTRLEILNGGAGFTRGKLRITDRSGATAEIDLRYARTLEDVQDAVNSNTDINVRLEAHGDRLRLVDLTGQTVTNLRVQEVGAGTTAASLGLSAINVAANEANGTDIVRLFGGLNLNALNDDGGVRFNNVLPDLQVSFRDGSSPLSIDFRKLAVLGTKSTATTPGTQSTNAKVLFTAVEEGTDFDDVTISFVDNAGITAGSETVVYDDSDPDNKTLIFQIDAGNTTAANIIDALNDDPTASLVFTAENATGSDGTGLIDVADTVVSAGGVNAVPAGTEATIADVLATINAADPARLQAELSTDGDQIRLIDLTAGGGTFAVTALNDSKAAADLGLTGTAVGGVITSRRLISGLGTSLLTSLNGAAGLGTLGLLNLTDRSGASAGVNLSWAETLDDVVEAINDAGLGITARVNSARNGLLLTDTTGSTASNLIVANGDGTNTADKLNLDVNAATTSVNSGSLKRRVVSENTLLASLNGGAGVAKGTFTLQDTNGSTRVINLANGTFNTVGDVIDEINRAGLDVLARINDAGDGILLVDTADGPSSLQVIEGNKQTAADLHLLGEAETIDIGGTPTKVIDGSTTIDIEITETDTIATLAEKINGLSLGVTASVFNDGSGLSPFRLTLTSQRAGQAGELLIDSSLSPFTFEETTEAQDALLLFGSPTASGSGIIASSNTNTFKDVLPGVNVTLQGASTDPVTINVATSTTSLTAGVLAAVENYNRLREKLNDLTAFDAELDEKGLLLGDASLLRVETDLSRVLSGRIFGAGSIQSLETMGITLNDDGTLEFDSAKLEAEFEEDPTAVEDFFTTEDLGLSDRLEALIEQLAGEDDSLLTNRLDALRRKIEENDERIETMNSRLEVQSERLLNQFVQLELAVSQIQSNLTFLEGIGPLTVNQNNNRRSQ